MPVITVSQINRYVSFKLKGDKNLQGIMVKGEISDLVRHYQSGHIYFTLKDSESTLKAVMFASAASRLRFTPESGMSVIVSGSIGVYEKGGVYQLYANDMLPDGAGAANIALEQLKKKLAAAGIFDQAHKRQLPVMPSKIGAVTSLSGAAVRDIINVLSRRYPIGELYAVNALVQGEGAADSICRGILRAEQSGCDVIIVGRGGGSSEDLSAFNAEKVAYAVYNCKVPVISAVGHETDFTLCDLAADMRAPTPSAAAELSAPSAESISENISLLERRAEKAFSEVLRRAEDMYTSASLRLRAFSPENRLKSMEENLTALENRCRTAAERVFERAESQLERSITALDSLSPLKVLSRGYSLVYSGEELVRDSQDITEGSSVKIVFSSGGAEAEIKKKW